MMKRRQFLKAGTAGTVAASSLMTPLTSLAAPSNEEILVYIFLRGGIDGCNVVVPLGSNDHEYYSLMRPVLAIPDTGAGAALPLGTEPFGLNPVASPLKDLYDAGHLAIINATGTPNDIASRSHFDAEKYIELGTPGTLGTLSGWLHRHFLSMTDTLNLYPDEIFVPIMAFSNNPPVSLLGNNATLSVWSPGSFRLDNAHWRWNYQEDDWEGEKGYMQLEAIPEIYGMATSQVNQAGSQALAAEAILRTSYQDDYVSSGSIPYGGDGISRQLSDVAQVIKLDMGSRLFTLDVGGWDTHEGQSNDGAFNNPLAALSTAIAAFLDDLDASGSGYADKTTIILQSEFGRRAYENNSQGTDHGNGNFMMAIGKPVNGGSIYGTWPGLYPGTEDGWVDYVNPVTLSTDPELFNGALSVTTDFRRILSDYLSVRCQHNASTLGYVFPGYTNYSPMGLFAPLPTPSEFIFSDSFEGTP